MRIVKFKYNKTVAEAQLFLKYTVWLSFIITDFILYFN